MDDMGFAVLVLVIALGSFFALSTCLRRHAAMQVRLQEANQLGWRLGYFQGWIAHAKRVQLHVVPPTLFEVEEVLRQRHGWREWPRDSVYDYLRMQELSDGMSPQCSAWEEWQARKLKELNEKYLQ